MGCSPPRAPALVVARPQAPSPTPARWRRLRRSLTFASSHAQKTDGARRSSPRRWQVSPRRMSRCVASPRGASPASATRRPPRRSARVSPTRIPRSSCGQPTGWAMRANCNLTSTFERSSRARQPWKARTRAPPRPTRVSPSRVPLVAAGPSSPSGPWPVGERATAPWPRRRGTRSATSPRGARFPTSR